MVVAHAFAMRALLKAVTLGAIALTAFSSVQAQLGTEIPTPMPTANSSLPCGISDGDQAVGVQVVDDPTCAVGGVGCYNSHCRHCKVVATPKSEHLLNCSSFGVDFPVYESGEVFVGDCEVASGDAAVGISAVADPDCLYGGLGCYNSNCRFCKVKTTPQSANFLECAGFGTTPIPISSAPTSTPAPTTKTPVSTTPSLTASPTSPESTTSAPAQGLCSTVVSPGDAAVGINILTDAMCSSGGVGCIDDVCRFCKVTTTLQSAAFIDCDLIGVRVPSAAPSPSAATTNATPSPKPTTASIVLECSRSVTSGDASVGLDIVSDITCSNGGAGCLDEVCRFCKRFETAQSSSYTSCADIAPADLGLDISFVPIATVDDTETPVPSDLIVVTSDIKEASAGPGICSSITLADGESAGGISLVLDKKNCPAGVTPGCIGDLGCKYCQKFASNVSEHLDYCLTSAASTVLAQTSGIAEASTTTSAHTKDPFKSIIIQWGMGVAACIGTAVVVIGVAFGMRRSLPNSSCSSALPTAQDDAAEQPRTAALCETESEVTVVGE